MLTEVMWWMVLVRMLRRRCTTIRETCKPRHLTLCKVLWGAIGTIARYVAHLVRLLGIEHHLLISPLCKLSVSGRIEIRVLLGYVSRRCMWAMDVIRWLLGLVLIEGRVKGLSSDRGRPTSLRLLLYRIGVRLLRLRLLLLRLLLGDDCRRLRRCMVACGRRALTRD